MVFAAVAVGRGGGALTLTAAPGEGGGALTLTATCGAVLVLVGAHHFCPIRGELPIVDSDHNRRLLALEKRRTFFLSLDLAPLAPLAPFLPLPWLLAAASNVGKASSFQPDHTALLATWENVGVPDCTRKRSSTTSDHNRCTPEDTRPSESIMTI